MKRSRWANRKKKSDRVHRKAQRRAWNGAAETIFRLEGVNALHAYVDRIGHRVLCPHCRGKSRQPPRIATITIDGERQVLFNDWKITSPEGLTIAEGTYCKLCGHKGYITPQPLVRAMAELGRMLRHFFDELDFASLSRKVADLKLSVVVGNGPPLFIRMPDDERPAP